ncbi:MAG: hypothetical protein IJ681_07315 [Bacteroidales bacterium]|nr:hypothetical protein [Bacteroidales bacterium]
MINKTLIITLISAITVGAVSTGIMLYAGNNKTVAQVEQTVETNSIQQSKPKESWTKVGEHLYFDTESLNIQTDLIGGVFKEYNYNNDKSYNEKNYAYKTIKTMAYCDIELQGGIKKLEFPIFKYYDENNKLVDEYSIHEIWRKEYPDGHLGITHPEDEPNGEIYFNNLCKYYSPEKD